MVTLSAALFLFSSAQTPQPPRFESASPLPGLPSIMIDRRLDGISIAQRLARSRGWQGRVMWVDATANLDRFNGQEKVEALCQRIADCGFNTIVLDVKPISGQVIYESAIAPKITEWRGRRLDSSFDPIPHFSRHARRLGLSFFISLNAFSEGHSMFKAGPGYQNPSWQTVLYEPSVFVDLGGTRLPVAQKIGDSSSSSLIAFTDPSKLPAPAEGSFAITIDAKGRVVDGFERGGMGPGSTTIPEGGCLLLAKGRLASELKISAVPGMSAPFVVEPQLVPISDRPDQQYPLMTNPLSPEVHERNLAILRELLSKYDFDGILYDDRLRYGGLNADFSPRMRAAFEGWLGRKVQNWPEGVYRIVFAPNMVRGIEPGPQYENWLIFRAKVMRDYIVRVRSEIAKVRKCQFGIYAGSWYGEYGAYGANYGSQSLEAGFWYLSSAYSQTGFADQLDLLVSGCYYKTPTIFDALRRGQPIGQTVEMAAALCGRVVDDETWVYPGIMLLDYAKDPNQLKPALQAACATGQGVMVFDYSHDFEKFEKILKAAFATPSKAPHVDPRNLAELRSLRTQAQRRGDRKPPVTIATGSAGAGH